jgi:hypothetical protein
MDKSAKQPPPQAARRRSRGRAGSGRVGPAIGRRGREADVHVAARHQALAPTQRSVPTRTQQVPTGTNLIGKIRVDRDYRVRAYWTRGNATCSVRLPSPLRANEIHEFHIELWPPGRTQPEAEAVVLKLWPPSTDDPVEYWTCECGRAVAEGGDSEPAHWEIRLPVEPPDTEPFFAAVWRRLSSRD